MVQLKLLALLAQAGPEQLSGGAGWAGAGLLGLVLSWLLLVHLPGKDKQLKELLDKHDDSMSRQRSEFGTQLDRIAQHCEEEMSRSIEQSAASLKLVTETFHSAVDRIRDSINGLRGK